jgi:hypothetical protein
MDALVGALEHAEDERSKSSTTPGTTWEHQLRDPKPVRVGLRRAEQWQ